MEEPTIVVRDITKNNSPDHRQGNLIDETEVISYQSKEPVE